MKFTGYENVVLLRFENVVYRPYPLSTYCHILKMMFTYDRYRTSGVNMKMMFSNSTYIIYYYTKIGAPDKNVGFFTLLI